MKGKNMNFETLTTQQQELSKQLYRFMGAYGFNHEGARYLWNAIVTDFGEATVPYLNQLAIPAKSVNDLFMVSDREEAEYQGYVSDCHAIIEECVTAPLF